MKSVIANENITAKSVRVVEEGSSNVMAIADALRLAYSKDLDLIQVSEQEVPVVKMANLNKYLYDQKQSEKEAKKKQRQSTTQVKEVQFTFGTQEHDLNTKAKSALKFISEGKQVRIVMKIDGRISNQGVLQQNTDAMSNFVKRLGEIDLVQTIAIQGKFITCTVKAK